VRRYDDYLRSRAWQRVRSRYRRVRPWRCGICGATDRLELHYRTYERLGAEQLDDLVPLCDDCHPLLHQLVREKQATLDPSSAFDPARSRPFTPPPHNPRRSTPPSEVTAHQPERRERQPWQKTLSEIRATLVEQERRGRRR
jgi:hypothetical protein